MWYSVFWNTPQNKTKTTYINTRCAAPEQYCMLGAIFINHFLHTTNVLTKKRRFFTLHLSNKTLFRVWQMRVHYYSLYMYIHSISARSECICIRLTYTIQSFVHPSKPVQRRDLSSAIATNIFMRWMSRSLINDADDMTAIDPRSVVTSW